MKHSRILVFSLLFFLTCSTAVKKDQSLRPVQIAPAEIPVSGLEMPAQDESIRVLNHTAYAIGYSDQYREARWVAYVLTADMLNTQPRVKRSNRFVPDPLLPVDLAVRDAVYKRSGYDRGHLLPAADMTHSEETMLETFYLSNITPQKPMFNQRIWEDLEDQVRKWAKRDGKIYVVTGPVLSTNLEMLKGTLPIPAVFYKAILYCSGRDVRAIGFLMKNEEATQPISAFAVTIDRIEAETGLDLFYQLPDEIEVKVESQCNVNDWKF